MAKYKLTKVSYYEDNEQAGDDNYNQQYVQDAADAEVVYWNRTEVELQVNDGKVYKAVTDGGPTDHPERRTKWPWVLASEMLPPGDTPADDDTISGEGGDNGGSGGDNGNGDLEG